MTKSQLFTLLGSILLALGLTLSGLRLNEILQFTITDGLVLSVRNDDGECRRVSGRTEPCQMGAVEVEYEVDLTNQKLVGLIEVDRGIGTLVSGQSKVKVMYLDSDPRTVRLADFSSGWKGGLGVLFLGALVLFVSRLGRPAAS